MFDKARPQRLRWFVVAIGLLAAQNAVAESVEDFYRGKTLSLVVSTTAGTSYDLMSRTLAKYLPKHIPGNPNFIVRNMPGAGGLTAANYLYRVALKDGTVIGGLQGTLPFDPLLGIKEANFDANKFNWLGSASEEVCLLVVRAGASVDNINDLKTHEITVGASSNTSQPAFFARLVNQTVGTKLRIVLGYPGQNDVFLAMERGEVDGHACVYYSALAATRPDWIRDRKVKLIVQTGPEKEQTIADVPFTPDLVKDPGDKRMIEAAVAPLALGRPYAMPPEVPMERVGAMRRAFDAVLKDQAFLDEIKSLKLQVNAPLSGERVQSLIRSIYVMPPEIIDRVRKLVEPSPR